MRDCIGSLDIGGEVRSCRWYLNGGGNVGFIRWSDLIDGDALFEYEREFGEQDEV